MALGAGIRVTNRKPAMAAAATLLVMMAGHTVLETARDSLFLARLPVTQLPWTYAAIALAVFVALRLDARFRAAANRQRLLSGKLLVGGAGSIAFLLPFRAHAAWAPHAFYIWIGVVATLATSEFWLLLSDQFAVAEAKQVYARIGAGGLVGSMLGGAIARAVTPYFGDVALVIVGGSLMLLSGLIPSFQAAPVQAPTPPQLGDAGGKTLVRDLRSERYLRRLLILTLLATLVATFVDYAFKTQVVSTVPAAKLGRFFASLNFVLSAVALLAQFVIAPRLLGTVGVGRALLVLPTLLAMAGGAALFAPGLVTSFLLRATDGSLRSSLHRSAVEVLYLPLPSAARTRWKMLVDALGQRAGQALASFVILICIALSLPPWFMLTLIVTLSVAWLALSRTMEQHYLTLFRAKIRAGTIETRADVPALDLRSLETLVSALGSENDDEVLATIDLLADYDRAHVIPSLLLLHPSRAIVLRTLEVLASSGRHDFMGAARRLLAREDDEIRAAAMLALAHQADPDRLRAELEQAMSIAVRAAILVGLLARDLDADGTYAEEVERGCAPTAHPGTRLAYARAFRLQADARFVHSLAVLAQNAEPELEQEVASAMLATPNVEHIPQLLAMLKSRDARAVARDALVAIGDEALQALAQAFDDPAVPRQLRTHLPRSVSRFGSAAATDILLDRLERDAHGWVRFKSIRGLGQLRVHLRSAQRTRRVLAHAGHNLARAAHFMAWRLATEADRAADPRLVTQGGELLVSVLREKELHAVDRCVRLLGLLHNADVIHNIRQALASRDARLRSDGIELLVHVAPNELGHALAVMLASGQDVARLDKVLAALHETVPPTTYQERLEHMLADSSEAVRSVAAYHVGELGMTTLSHSFDAAAQRASGLSSDVFARVGAALKRAGARGKFERQAATAAGDTEA